MTLDRARRVFASHMAAARTRQLTAYEKRELTTARQMLRRSRRPAGLSKVNYKGAKYPKCVVCGKPTKQIRGGQRVHERCKHKLTQVGARPPAKNPSGLIRMGKLVEIRYERDHGAQKGYYRHPFKVRPVIYYRPSDNSILIKGGK